MKKIVIFFVIIHFCFSLKAQQKSFNYPVLLFPISDYTAIRVNGENKDLNEIRECSINEKIEVVKGKLSLLDAYGNETTLDSGNQFNVKGKSKKNSSQLYSSMDKLSKFMKNPSVYLPNLYSNDRNEYVIFPLKSKVSNTSNIQFQLSEYILPTAKLVLYDDETDTIVYQSSNVSNIDFRKAKLNLGKKYIWRLYNGSNSSKGEFELLSQKQIKKIVLKELNTKQDYLKSIILYLENGCKFDAVATLNSAIEAYPESTLFKKLRTKIPSKTNEY